MTSKKPERDERRGRGPELDWAAPHGPFTGALSATTGCAAIALAGTAAGMPWMVPAAIGAAGALGHGIGLSLWQQMTAMTMRTRACSWLAAGGWTSWAIAAGPLSWAAAGSLAALGVGVGAMATTSAVHEEAAETQVIAEQVRLLEKEVGRERAEIAADWHQRIARVCALQIESIVGVDLWENGAGFSLDLQLPAGPHTRAKIVNHLKSLAIDARLPNGCTVTYADGADQSRLVLKVTTRNIMADVVPYPMDDLHQPLSILTGIPWGLLPDSHPVVVYLREVCALILGTQGSGKSTFVDAVIAGFLRTTDVLVWVIDLKDGNAGRAWTRPYLEAQGLVDVIGGVRPPSGTRPGVDWLAGTVAEAGLMLSDLLRIYGARQREYQELMARHNTTLLPVSAAIPQIELIIDEGMQLLAIEKTQGSPARKKLRTMLLDIMELCRAMAIRVILTALDGNVASLGDSFIRKSAPVNVALTAASSTLAHVDKMFPGCKVDSDQLTARGSGVIGAATPEGFDPTPFKGWKTTPDFARDVVLATTGWRPRLDIPSIAATLHYADRWSPERAGWLWAKGTDNTAVRAEGASTESGTTTTLTRPTDSPTGGGRGLNLSAHRDQGGGGEDADELAARLTAEIDAVYGTTEEPERPTPGAERPTGLNLSAHRARPEAARPEPADTQEPADTEPPTERPGELAPEPLAGPDWLTEWLTPAPSWLTPARRRMYELLAEVGEDGISPKAMSERLGEEGLATVRETVSAWFKEGLREVDGVQCGVVLKLGRGTYILNPGQPIL